MGSRIGWLGLAGVALLGCETVLGFDDFQRDAAGAANGGATYTTGGATANGGAPSSGGANGATGGSPAAGANGTGGYCGPGAGCTAEQTCLDSRCVDNALIDDMVDGDTAILRFQGRDGFWSNGHDDTTIETMNPPAGAFTMTRITDAKGQRYVASEEGSLYVDWGWFYGFKFRWDGSNYDASAYGGLRFSIISPTAPAGGSITVHIEITSQELEEGCQTTGCGAYYGKDIQVTPEWQEIDVRFNELTPKFSTPQPFNAAHLRVVWVEFPTGDHALIEIDSIRFIP